jgi:hypothetical protein
LLTSLVSGYDCPSVFEIELEHRLTAISQDFVFKKKDYLLTQVGNPDGADKPNKKVRRLVIFCRFPTLMLDCSSMTPVSGFVKARKRSQLGSRRLAVTSGTLVSVKLSLAVY